MGADRTETRPADAALRRASTVTLETGQAETEAADPAPRARDPFDPGAVIGPYEVIRGIGRGGMGRVVMARDTKLGRRVAIKLLTRASPLLGERFLREARTTAQLSHEHIVVIHEVSEHAGVPFMVLEYLEGQPLSALIHEGGVPWGRAVELVVPIVRALAHAHDLGVVHRDLKPDNVFLTRTGTVKVLDFGIARAFADAAEGDAPGGQGDPAAPPAPPRDLRLTQEGAILGTLPYMAPEQCHAGEVDARTDLWAVGLILYELLAGRHPLAPFDARNLFRCAAELDEPMPRIADAVPELPEALERAIDGCLRKRRAQRLASARDLLALLEPLLPGRVGRALVEGESPYVGLGAFQEGDAGRFFGRRRDVQRVVARLHDHPLVAIAGPSGVGKSSFVRAGVIPALKASGEVWESFTLRPGRDPLAALASLLQPFTTSSALDVAAKAAEHEALAARLRAEPGTLGTLLRSRARQRGSRILLFVDQLEELYTLVDDDDARRAFADGLAGVADDSATPLRVIVSIRSDFLDRVAEHDRLVGELARGLAFLSPPDRDGLREAIEQPLELAGYRFESPAIVDDMLATLTATPAALPLLQFVASRLWDARDRPRHVITAGAYAGIGGIAGALASHADEALAQVPLDGQRLVRAIVQRLVTPERTRAIVDTADLLDLGAPGEVGRVLDQLVAARLLVVQTRGDDGGATVEIVHESLISSWPRLRRWLDESEEQSAFVARLQAAAKQWDATGRSAGLVWRGEAADDARRWAAALQAPLAPRERAYLDAVIRLATRATRLRRLAVIATIALLGGLVVVAALAVAVIRDAERGAQREAARATTEAARAHAEATRAQAEAERARQAEEHATREAERARAAERESAQRLAELEQKDQALATERGVVAQSREELRAANARLEAALATARDERARADEARRRAEDTAAHLRKVLAEKEAELRKLEKLNREF